MRRGELLARRAGDVDLNDADPFVTIRHALSAGESTLLLLALVALGVGLDEDQPVVESERFLLPPSTLQPRGLRPRGRARRIADLARRSRSGPGVAN